MAAVGGSDAPPSAAGARRRSSVAVLAHAGGSPGPRLDSLLLVVTASDGGEAAAATATASKSADSEATPTYTEDFTSPTSAAAPSESDVVVSYSSTATTPADPSVAKSPPQVDVRTQRSGLRGRGQVARNHLPPFTLADDAAQQDALATSRAMDIDAQVVDSPGTPVQSPPVTFDAAGRAEGGSMMLRIPSKDATASPEVSPMQPPRGSSWSGQGPLAREKAERTASLRGRLKKGANTANIVMRMASGKDSERKALGGADREEPSPQMRRASTFGATTRANLSARGSLGPPQPGTPATPGERRREGGADSRKSSHQSRGGRRSNTLSPRDAPSTPTELGDAVAAVRKPTTGVDSESGADKAAEKAAAALKSRAAAQFAAPGPKIRIDDLRTMEQKVEEKRKGIRSVETKIETKKGNNERKRVVVELQEAHMQRLRDEEAELDALEAQVERDERDLEQAKVGQRETDAVGKQLMLDVGAIDWAETCLQRARELLERRKQAAEAEDGSWQRLQAKASARLAARRDHLAERREDAEERQRQLSEAQAATERNNAGGEKTPFEARLELEQEKLERRQKELQRRKQTLAAQHKEMEEYNRSIKEQTTLVEKVKRELKWREVNYRGSREEMRKVHDKWYAGRHQLEEDVATTEELQMALMDTVRKGTDAKRRVQQRWSELNRDAQSVRAEIVSLKSQLRECAEDHERLAHREEEVSRMEAQTASEVRRNSQTLKRMRLWERGLIKAAAELSDLDDEQQYPREDMDAWLEELHWREKEVSGITLFNYNPEIDDKMAVGTEAQALDDEECVDIIHGMIMTHANETNQAYLESLSLTRFKRPPMYGMRPWSVKGRRRGSAAGGPRGLSEAAKGDSASGSVGRGGRGSSCSGSRDGGAGASRAPQQQHPAIAVENTTAAAAATMVRDAVDSPPPTPPALSWGEGGVRGGGGEDTTTAGLLGAPGAVPDTPVTQVAHDDDDDDDDDDDGGGVSIPATRAASMLSPAVESPDYTESGTPWVGRGGASARSPPPPAAGGFAERIDSRGDECTRSSGSGSSSSSRSSSLTVSHQSQSEAVPSAPSDSASPEGEPSPRDGARPPPAGDRVRGNEGGPRRPRRLDAIEEAQGTARSGSASASPGSPSPQTSVLSGVSPLTPEDGATPKHVIHPAFSAMTLEHMLSTFGSIMGKLRCFDPNIAPTDPPAAHADDGFDQYAVRYAPDEIAHIQHAVRRERALRVKLRTLSAVDGCPLDMQGQSPNHDRALYLKLTCWWRRAREGVQRRIADVTTERRKLLAANLRLLWMKCPFVEDQMSGVAAGGGISAKLGLLRDNGELVQPPPADDTHPVRQMARGFVETIRGTTGTVVSGARPGTAPVVRHKQLLAPKGGGATRKDRQHLALSLGKRDRARMLPAAHRGGAAAAGVHDLSAARWTAAATGPAMPGALRPRPATSLARKSPPVAAVNRGLPRHLQSQYV